MQCACAILSSVACPDLQYFSTLFQKRHDFRKKVTETKCVLIFPTTFVWNISHSKTKWARYDKIMYIGFQVKYPLFFSDFNEIWILQTDFRKYSNIKFQKIRQVWAELFHADGRTDMTKLIVAFRCFAKAPKNYTRTIFGHILSIHRPLFRLHLKRVYPVSMGFYSPMGLYSETYHARFLRHSSRFIFHKQSSYIFFRFYIKETFDVTSSN
jgi:hypothetical protein